MKHIDLKECVHIESLNGATNDLLTSLNEFEVTLTYPLEKPYHIFTTGGSGGYTVREFADLVRNGYREAYKQSDVFKPWGHSFGELWLEGVIETKPGVFELEVGS